MLSRSATYALRALLELAQDPTVWRSVNELASAQDLPAPMLEQLMLKLRRADLLEARRGRLGGYRLRQRPAEISLATILAAVESPVLSEAKPSPPVGEVDPGERVTRVLNRRLLQALERELDRLSLEDLVYDLRSTRASLSEDAGLLLG